MTEEDFKKVLKFRIEGVDEGFSDMTERELLLLEVAAKLHSESVGSEIFESGDQGGMRFRYEQERQFIYDSSNERIFCMYFDDAARNTLLNALNSYVK